MQSFTGKLAVVTGGGTGMGRELARQLAAEGCDVAICDVSATNMADTLAACEVEAPDATVTSFVADVSSEDALLAFRDHVTTAHQTDHLDLLFNNAGIGGGGSIVNDAREEWEQVFNVCWGGVYLGVRTFLPLLIASPEARIVNTSSVNGFWATLGPTTSHTAYSAAKFAVIGLTQSMAGELGEHGVTVNAICPGTIDTPLLAVKGGVYETFSGAAGRTEEDYRRRLARQIPARRFGTPEDIAAAAVYLASDGAAFVTGEALNVTGGQEMH
jgi:NAD(P)-dependent dehydrogenase (short-subunit alcohol dehydrogenase family)